MSIQYPTTGPQPHAPAAYQNSSPQPPMGAKPYASMAAASPAQAPQPVTTFIAMPAAPPSQPGLKPTERLFIEKTLIQMYPHLQRHDLLPWKLFHGPLIPDFLIRQSGGDLRRIVVIGCGDGVLCNTLALLFPGIEIVGIDNVPARIARARATVGYRKNLKFICGNAAAMQEIPCDRIIYQRCLETSASSYAFKKLVVKTVQWLVDDGDFIVNESPLSLLFNLNFLKGYLPRLRHRKHPEQHIRGALAEVGYPNPLVFSCNRLPGLPSEVFYRYSKTLTLTAMLNQPQQAMGEWLDEAEQSHDSALDFLFSNRQTDFSRELNGQQPQPHLVQP